MKKDRVLSVAMVVLLLSLIGGAVLYYYQNKVAADVLTSTTTLTAPAAGLKIQVVASDGKTGVNDVQISVIAAAVNNSAVANYFSVTAADRGSGTSDKLSGNNLKQNVLTTSGQNNLAANTALSSLYQIIDQASGLVYTSSDASADGVYYLNENSLKQSFVPVRAYVSYGGQTVVSDLLAANKTGNSASDYTYKIGTLNSIVIKLPVDVSSLTSNSSVVAFKALNLENNPVAGVNFSVTVYATYNGSVQMVPGLKTISNQAGIAKISQASIENAFDAKYGDINNPNKYNVDFSQDIRFLYGCERNNIQCGSNPSWTTTWAKNYLDQFTILGKAGRTQMPSVSRVAYLDTDRSTGVLPITFKTDKTTYAGGATVTATVIFSGTGNPVTIQRTTLYAVQYSLLDDLGNTIAAYKTDSLAVSVSPYVETKKSGDSYVETFTLVYPDTGAVIPPGNYTLVANVANMSQTIDPVAITVTP